MNKLKRLQKKSDRLYLKLRKIEKQMEYIDDCIKLYETATTDTNPIHSMYPKQLLNKAYGKIYSDTDSIEDGMKYTE